MSKNNEIAVSSVAAFNPEGKLLFGLRSDSSKWTLPGGHANEGESPEKCAVRELLEESGLKPTELEYIGEGRVPREDGRDIRVSAFRAQVEGEPTTENDPDSEISEFRWVDVSDGLPDEIAHNLFAPMNVTLRLFGLQGGKLLKADSYPSDVFNSPATLAEVVARSIDPAAIANAILKTAADESVYRAVLDRDWTEYYRAHGQHPTNTPPERVLDSVLKKLQGARANPQVIAPSDQLVKDLWERAKAFEPNWAAHIFYSKGESLPDSFVGELLGRFDTYEWGSPIALLAGRKREFFDKYSDSQIELLKRVKNSAETEGEEDDKPVRARFLRTLSYIGYPDVCDKEKALKIYNIWPQKMGKLLAFRPDLDSGDISTLLKTGPIDKETAPKLLSLPAARPEHLAKLIEADNPSLLANTLRFMKLRYVEPLLARLLTPENTKAIINNTTDYRPSLVESIAQHIPKEALDELIATETNSQILSALAQNPNADKDTVEAFAAAHLDRMDIFGGVVTSRLLETVHRDGKAQMPYGTWSNLANHPNEYIRIASASSKHAPDLILESLGLDPSSEVWEAVAGNGKLASSPELLRWLGQEAPSHVVHNAVSRFGDKIVGAVKHRALLDPDIASEILDYHRYSFHNNEPLRQQMIDSDILNHTNVYGDFLRSARQSGAPLTQIEYNKLFERLFNPMLSNEHRRDMFTHHFAGPLLLGASVRGSEEQGRRLVQAEMANPGPGIFTGGLETALSRRNSHIPIPEDALGLLTTHPAESIRKAALSKLGPINPDALHQERVSVRFNTGKLRAIRDLILESGQDSLPVNKLPPMEWDVPLRDEHGNVVKRKVQKKGKEVEEAVKAPLPVRDAKGNISATMLQQYIDSLPGIEFNVSHGKSGLAPKTMLGGSDRRTAPAEEYWTGAQRHTDEPSKVFQLNITNQHVAQMRAKGSWQTYRNQASAVHSTGHPVRPEQTTIGWVRYTGTPEEGIHIDEIQSDFGQSFIRIALAEAHEKAQKDAIERGLTKDSKEYNEYVQDFVQRIRSEAENKWPDEHNKNIASILFAGRHCNEVLHEAFHQYLRDRGFAGAKIAIHTPESRAPLSGMEKHKELPVHYKITYGEVPKKMGYKPSTYGSLPTQSNKEIAAQTGWKKDPEDDKWGPSNETWETIVRKYESYNLGIDCFYRLAKADDDLADKAQQAFDADESAKWHAHFLNPETPLYDLHAKVRGIHHDSEKFKLTAPYLMKVLNSRIDHAPLDGVRLAATALATFDEIGGLVNEQMREAIWDKLAPLVDNHPTEIATSIESVVYNLAESASPRLLGKILDKTGEDDGLNDEVIRRAMRDDFTPQKARIILGYVNGTSKPPKKIAQVTKNVVMNLSHSTQVDERNKLWDELARRYGDKPIIHDADEDIDLDKALRTIVEHGLLSTARYLMATPRAIQVARTFFHRPDINEQDIDNFLDRDDKFSAGSALEAVMRHPAFNQRHLDKAILSDASDDATRRLALVTAEPKLFKPEHVDRLLKINDDGRTLGRVLEQKIASPEQIDRILDDSDGLTRGNVDVLSGDTTLSEHQLHKLIRHAALSNSHAAIMRMEKNPKFGPAHLASMERLMGEFKDNVHLTRMLGERIVKSPHASVPVLLSLIKDDPLGQHYARAVLDNPSGIVFKHPDLIQFYVESEELRSSWASEMADYRNNNGILDTPATFDDDTMKRLLRDKTTGHHILQSHPFSDDMLRWIAHNAPLQTIHKAKQSFPMDVRHALFARTQAVLDSEPDSGSYEEKRGAAKLLQRLVDPTNVQFGIPDLTGEQLSTLVDKYEPHVPAAVEIALDHPNFPVEKLKSIAQRAEHSDLRTEARNRIGIQDPDAIHSEHVHVKFDLGKARAIRDMITASGQEELRPKEIPNLPNGWKLGKNPKNGNISAKLLQEEIDKAPVERYNISHTEYGEDRNKPQREDCSDCDGSGEVPREVEETCEDCDGTGRPPDEDCRWCDGNGKPECSECSGDGKIDDTDCENCGGLGNLGECENCEGLGAAPPPCRRCEGAGRVNGRTCSRCDGDKVEKCQNCEGSGQVMGEENESCETCDGTGRIDGDEAAEQAYENALSSQQHNLKPSQVVQVNFSTKHVNQMRETGVWNTFRNMYEAYNNSNHPVTPSTIGWIRYTYGGEIDGKPRYYIDEVQSDFGQSFVRQAINQGIEEGKNRARQKGLVFNTPEWADAVRKFAAEAKAMAEQKWPEAHHKNIAEILFGKDAKGKGRHSNEVLFEAFFQHLRDKGHDHAVVTMPHAMAKVGSSFHGKVGTVCKGCGRSSAEHQKHGDFDEERFNLLNPSKACDKFESTGKKAKTDIPVHANITYIELPIANGMEPSTYGHSGNPDESNPHLEGRPTWKGPVRKYEEEYPGSRNLHKVDLFEDAEWTTST